VSQHPHGIDLGPLQPCLPRRLSTPDKRIQLAPELLLADLSRARTELLAPRKPESGELALIGRRQLRSNNSWMHNSHRLVRGRDRCTLLMHPEDAAARGLATNAQVCVRSRVGEIRLTLVTSEEMMPGVVSIPHGWGHQLAGIQLGIAAAHAGVSINDVTDEQQIDTLTGNAAFSGIRVMVSASG